MRSSRYETLQDLGIDKIRSEPVQKKISVNTIKLSSRHAEIVGYRINA